MNTASLPETTNVTLPRMYEAAKSRQERTSARLKPFRVSAYFPADLKGALEARLRTGRFPSIAAYTTALLMEDLAEPNRPSVIADLAREPDFIRQAIAMDLAQKWEPLT